MRQKTIENLQEWLDNMRFINSSALNTLCETEDYVEYFKEGRFHDRESEPEHYREARENMQWYIDKIREAQDQIMYLQENQLRLAKELKEIAKYRTTNYTWK